jgi:hypothetical protein
MNEIEEPVAALIQPTEYAHHLNQVASVTSRDIIFNKRKFVSRTGHELVRHPLSTCSKVRYVDERPLLTIVSGLLLVALVTFILYMLATNWNDLTPGTRVPVGLLALAGFYGVRRVLGARRHRLIFTLRDKTRLTWTSRPGEYEVKRLAAERIVEFARSLEILDDSRLRRG